MISPKGIQTQFEKVSSFANQNKFFLGLTMILFNLGSKYIVMDISKSHEMFLKSTIIRRITIFCMFFVATRDLFVSLTCTSIFIILALGIFNEKSSLTVLPASLFDDTVTEEEYKLAKDLIAQYENNKK
tara:strand:+ start:16925 stop:17311 length:387 start_codon:yes stop_codon:yes gene_type:complete